MNDCEHSNVGYMGIACTSRTTLGKFGSLHDVMSLGADANVRSWFAYSQASGARTATTPMSSRSVSWFSSSSINHTTGLPHFQFTAFSSFLLEIGILSKIEWSFAKKWVKMSGIEWNWVKLSKNKFIFQFDSISLNSTHFHSYFCEISLNLTQISDFTVKTQ